MRAGQSGIIISQRSNIVTNNENSHLCVCGASQNVAIWNLNTEERSVFETSSSSEVTRVQSKGNVVCAGFTDGRLVVWNIETRKMIFEGKGHKNAITALTHGDESVIASGGKDTDIVIWDTIREAGEFRLRGHNDEVTDLVFFAENKYLASTSKDTLFKVWCMETQCCVQTCVGHRSEVWSVAKHPSMPYLMTASSDRFVRMWKIQDDENVVDKNERLKLVGTLQRQAGGRSSEIRFNESGSHLACQSNSKGTFVVERCISLTHKIEAWSMRMQIVSLTRISKENYLHSRTPSILDCYEKLNSRFRARTNRYRSLVHEIREKCT